MTEVKGGPDLAEATKSPELTQADFIDSTVGSTAEAGLQSGNTTEALSQIASPDDLPPADTYTQLPLEGMPKAEVPVVSDSAAGQTVEVSTPAQSARAVEVPDDPTTTSAEAVTPGAIPETTPAVEKTKGATELENLDAELAKKGNLTAEQIEQRDTLRDAKREHDDLQKRADGGEDLTDDEEARLQELREDWGEDEGEKLDPKAQLEEDLKNWDPEKPETYGAFVDAMKTAANKLSLKKVNEVASKETAQRVKEALNHLLKPEGELNSAEQWAAKYIKENLKQMQLELISIIQLERQLEQMLKEHKSMVGDVKKAERELPDLLERAKKGDEEAAKKAQYMIFRYDQLAAHAKGIAGTINRAEGAADRFFIHQNRVSTELGVTGFWTGLGKGMVRNMKAKGKKVGRNIKSLVTFSNARPLAYT